MSIEIANGKRCVSVRLWTVNRWLRWTGWRLFVAFPAAVSVDHATGQAAFVGPLSLGLVWYGWSFVGHEPAAGRWPK